MTQYGAQKIKQVKRNNNNHREKPLMALNTIPKLCTYNGCKNTTMNGSRCAEHKIIKRDSKVLDHQLNNKGQILYKTQRWQKLSIRKRKIDGFCELCLKTGDYKVADVVDHWLCVEHFPQLTYEMSCLVSLCHSHHNRKTIKEKTLKGDALCDYLINNHPTGIDDHYMIMLRGTHTNVIDLNKVRRLSDFN